MEDNTTITQMDLRLTESGQEAEYCINQILHRNQERERESKICEPPAPSKKILPQAAHRFKPTKAWAKKDHCYCMWIRHFLLVLFELIFFVKNVKDGHIHIYCFTLICNEMSTYIVNLMNM